MQLEAVDSYNLSDDVTGWMIFGVVWTIIGVIWWGQYRKAGEAKEESSTAHSET